MSRLAEQFERWVPWIRSQFPQVDQSRHAKPRIYLDNAAGTLMPQTAADAMAEAALWANPQPGRDWPAGEETSRRHGQVRQMLADFLNAGEGDRIFFSESTTASLYKLREGLEPEWGAADNLVVTDCDHFANISAWEWRARWEVRRARMAPDGHLDLDHLAAQLDAGTRVVAMTLAGNGLGTVIDLARAVPLVRERAPAAVIVIDAVHGAPHLPIDLQTLGADALAFSAYKLFGPNCGVLWLRAGLSERLRPFRVEPHTDPETVLEWGTLSNVTVAGVRAALEYLRRVAEKLEPQFRGELTEYPRERRLYKVALTAIREYETALSRRVLAEWPHDRARLYGIIDPARAAERVPTFAFAIEGRGELERALWDLGRLEVPQSNHYSAAITRGLGLEALARASFAHYNSPGEADALLQALRRLPLP